MGLQHLHGQVAAFNACQAPLNVVGHICLHAGPVNTHLGQVHCLVDSCMASMEVGHDTISAGWWNDHSFTLGKDVSIDREFIMEAPVKSCHSGDMTLSVGPTIQGESVHHQEDGVPLCLCTDLGQTSQGEGKH